jgi:high-affinity Fe2+/Pb2+ permease
MHTLRGHPVGVVLLVVVAAGLVAYGVYSFLRARYGRI